MPPISYREKKEIVKTVKVQDVTNATTKFCKPCPELQKISVPVSVHKGKPLTPILQNSADSKVKPISHKKEMNKVKINEEKSKSGKTNSKILSYCEDSQEKKNSEANDEKSSEMENKNDFILENGRGISSVQGKAKYRQRKKSNINRRFIITIENTNFDKAMRALQEINGVIIEEEISLSHGRSKFINTLYELNDTTRKPLPPDINCHFPEETENLSKCKYKATTPDKELADSSRLQLSTSQFMPYGPFNPFLWIRLFLG